MSREDWKPGSMLGLALAAGLTLVPLAAGQNYTPPARPMQFHGYYPTSWGPPCRSPLPPPKPTLSSDAPPGDSPVMLCAPTASVAPGPEGNERPADQVPILVLGQEERSLPASENNRPVDPPTFRETIYLQLPAMPTEEASIRLAAAVPPQPEDTGEEERMGRRFKIQVELPTIERLMRLNTDASFREQLRQEGRDAGAAPYTFPEEPAADGPTGGRCRLGPGQLRTIEPSYVSYCHLFFEEKNSERYGWDLGPIHPLLSGATFYANVLTFPLKLASLPLRDDDCSAGYCLPGDPIPYLLYPPPVCGWYLYHRARSSPEVTSPAFVPGNVAGGWPDWRSGQLGWAGDGVGVNAVGSGYHAGR